MIRLIDTYAMIEKLVRGKFDQSDAFTGETFNYRLNNYMLKVGKNLNQESIIYAMCGSDASKYLKNNMHFLQVSNKSNYQCKMLDEEKTKLMKDTTLITSDNLVYVPFVLSEIAENDIVGLHVGKNELSKDDFNCLYHGIINKHVKSVVMCDEMYFDALKGKPCDLLIVKMIGENNKKAISIIKNEYYHYARLVMVMLNNNEYLLFIGGEVYCARYHISFDNYLSDEALMISGIKCAAENGNAESLLSNCLIYGVGLSLSNGELKVSDEAANMIKKKTNISKIV